ncbi:MAG: hypothetical protein JWR28_3435 [Modestobacter sp.]|nr:hypothetical protein [Modestobacter sp.]
MAKATAEQAAVPEGYKLKKKKPIYKRVWFWLLVIVLVIIVATVAGGGGSDPTVSGGSASASASASASSDASGSSAAPAGPTFQGQTKKDTTAEPGQTITLDDVAITSAALVDGDDTFGPTLCTNVTIVNNGKDSQSFNPYDYKLQDPAGASRDTTLGGSDNLLSSGDLAPGGTVTGDVCFDNKTAASGTYALIYAPAFSFSSERAVWVNNR